MKIAHHLTLQIFITAALFIPFLSAGTYFVARDILETTIRQSQSELNRNVMARIDRTLFRVMQDIRHLAGEKEVEAFMMEHADPGAVSGLWQNRLPDFHDNIMLTGPWLEIILVNRDSRICYSSEPVEIGTFFSDRHPEAVSGLDAALQGAAFISEVVMSPETGQPALVFASPIVNERTGEIYGAIIGHYAWLVIQQMLDEIRPPIRAFLLDRSGTIIAAQADRRQVVLVRNLSPIISVGGENDVYRDMVRLEEKEPPYLITMVSQSGLFSFRSHGWRMLMAVPKQVAHQPLQRLVISILVISTGVVLALGVAVFVLGKRIAAPIVMIKEKVQSISTGDYTCLIPDPNSSQNEIGLLIDAINRMTKDLLDSTVSRDYLTRIIQAMINGVIVVEPDGHIQSVNQAVLDLLKYRSEDLIGRHIGMIFAEETGSYHGNNVLHISQDQIQPTEKQFLTCDRQTFPVLFSSAVLRNKNGDIECVVCVAQDISDLKRMHNEMGLAQSSLIQSAKLSSIGELASGVAHELNQPLMVLRGTAQLIARSLRKGTLTPERLPEYLDSMDRNTKRMMTIINHMRTFSRQSDKEFEPVRVNGIIQDCFLMIGEQLKLRNIIVEMELDPDIPWVMGNANQLEQVILNLIINARDAIESRLQISDQEKTRMEQARIGIVTRSQYTKDGDESVEIWIRDTGSGISQQHRDRIFDPFFTTKPVGQGTGLGLSISYGIIKDHRGDISVVETGPEGTTFRITLPER